MKTPNGAARIVLIVYGLGVALAFLWVPWMDVGYWWLWSSPKPINIEKDIVVETRERWKANARANDVATLGPRWVEALREAPAKDKQKVLRDYKVAEGLAALRQSELNSLDRMSDQEVIAWLRNEQNFDSAFPENKKWSVAERKAVLDKWETTVPAAKEWNKAIQSAKTDYRRLGFELAALTALCAVAFVLAVTRI